MKTLCNVLLVLGGAILLAGCNTTTYTPAKTSAGGANLALGAKLTASSTRSEYDGEGPITNVVDGKADTRWATDYKDNQTLTIDLGATKTVTGLKLMWETAAAKTYAVSVSIDGKVWRPVKEQENGAKGPRTDNLKLGSVSARYIRLDLKERATEWGFSLYEVEVQGK